MHTKEQIIKDAKLFKIIFRYLEKAKKGLSAIYIECLNSKTEDTMKEFLSLLDIFILNCGVSKGYRTIAWDSAWGYYSEYIKGDSDIDFCDFVEHNVENFPTDYDVEVLDERQFAYILSTLFYEASDCRKALAKGSFRLLTDWDKFNNNKLEIF